MLAASGALAFVLHHDGVGLAAADAAHSQVGDEVRIRGTPLTHAPVAIRPLAALIPTLEASRSANETVHTAVIDGGEVVLWLLSNEPVPGRSVVVEGTIVARTRTSEAFPRPVVVIDVDGVTRPILFR